MQTSTAPAPSSDARNFAIFAHLLGLFTSWVAPLVIWLMKKNEPESSFAAEAAKEALNFQLTVFFFLIILMITMIGMFLLWIPMLANLVLSILAAVKASTGVAFRYPLTIRLIK